MSTLTFQVRRATPADKDEVIALSHAISPDDFIAEAYDYWMTYTGPDGFYVAHMDGRIIGCYCLEYHAPGQAYLFAMRIRPDMQGQGIGSRFCRMQVEHARSLGAQEIYLLAVLANDRSHRTVTRNGFVNRGEWIIYDGLQNLPTLPPARYSRWAGPEDQEAIERFRRERATGSLADVISSRWTCWATVTASPVDWELSSTVVCQGEKGLAGLMLLSQTEAGLLIRWLDGTPEAAMDPALLLPGCHGGAEPARTGAQPAHVSGAPAGSLAAQPGGCVSVLRLPPLYRYGPTRRLIKSRGYSPAFSLFLAVNHERFIKRPHSMR